MDLIVYQMVELEVVHVSDGDRAVKRFSCTSVTKLDLAVRRDRNALPQFPVIAVLVQIIQNLG